MQHKRPTVCFNFRFLLCSTAIVFGSCVASNDTFVRSEQEKSLAQTLNTRPEEYRQYGSFPLGYFISQLKKGMTINEVHSIVSGYEKVLKCENLPSLHRQEIYYYYSSDDDVADRFMVFFDDKDKFIGLGSEDTNSRSIQTKDCVEGKLDE